ncbi:MAG: hypothetical protein ACLP2X_15380 [Syntrophobacteraceae bacterium]
MSRFMWMDYPDSVGAEQIRSPANHTSVAGCGCLSGQASSAKFIDDFPNETEGRNRIIIGQVAELSDSCVHCWLDVWSRQIRMWRQSWLQTFNTKLSSMRTLADNWNGYGSAAPNRDAFRNAEDLMMVLHQKGLEPIRIAPSAEEGIAFTFMNGQKRALIECYNNGGICAAVFQKGMTPEVWTLGASTRDLEEAVDHIFAYLYA